MTGPGYPTVTVGLHVIENLRRTLSHLRQLHSQADVILNDLQNTVGNMPDLEDTDESGE